MIYKTIGQNIRHCRLVRQLTQEQLAEKAGISLSFLGHIERGSRKLSVDTLYRIAVALDCSVDELMDRVAEEEKKQYSAKELLRMATLMSENKR